MSHCQQWGGTVAPLSAALSGVRVMMSVGFLAHSWCSAKQKALLALSPPLFPLGALPESVASTPGWSRRGGGFCP